MTLQEKLTNFITRGEALKEHAPFNTGFRQFIISGSEFEQWRNELRVFIERNLKEHELYNDLNDRLVRYCEWDATFDEIMGKLQTIASDNEFFNSLNEIQIKTNKVSVELPSNDIFIVHGHNEEAIAKVEKFVRKMGLNPIILRDQASMGKTIIEKIEHYTNVGFAIVLYTPCDEMKDGQFRARQNVVLEHGYLMGKLGRNKVRALVKGDVEKPSDIDGIVYEHMDSNNAWETKLIRELKTAGYAIDANKLF